MAYLSFNETVNSNLKFTSDNSTENEEMLKKDLPLRYTWILGCWAVQGDFGHVLWC